MGELYAPTEDIAVNCSAGGNVQAVYPNRKTVMHVGTYRYKRIGMVFYVRLYSSGRLVAHQKYRWVVRVEYYDSAWASKGRTFQYKPDLIAAPLDAKRIVDNFLRKSGFDRIWPNTEYETHAPSSIESREFAAKLGCEPINNWPLRRKTVDSSETPEPAFGAD